MTVSAVKTLTTRDGSVAERSNRTYVMRYLVETTDSHDGAYTVLHSPSVPQIGTYYVGTNEYDLGARCVDARATHVDGDPKLWHVDCTFRSIQREDPEDQVEQAPEDREPTLSYRFEKRHVPLYGDYSDVANGKLDTTQGVANSLGQPFSPPPMIEETYPVLTVVRDDLALNMAELFEIQDTVNETAFSGAEAETLKLNVTGVYERFEDGKRLWRKTFDIAYNKRTWKTYVLDYGYKQDDDGNWRQILLDGSGGETDSTSPHYTAYTPYKLTEFRDIQPIRHLAAETI